MHYGTLLLNIYMRQYILPKDYAYKIVGYITESKNINLSLIDDSFRERIEFYRTLVPPERMSKYKKWRPHLIIMYNLLSDLEQDLLLDIPQHDVPKGIFRRFTLMPEFSIKPKHVNITNTILDEMASQLKVKSKDLWTYFFPNTETKKEDYRRKARNPARG